MVTILIRTKNEENRIEKVLSAILGQTYKKIEIVAVDGGSTDKTLRIMKKYPVKIYQIKPEEFTYGLALNYGFQKAKGEYIVSLNGHSLPLSKKWLETIISNFNDSKVAAVMCKILPWPDCNPFDRRGLLKRYNTQEHEITEGRPSIFSNASSVIRKDVWEKVHFDETLTASEDYDWLKKVRQLKYKIIYEPQAEVYHSHNWTLKQIYMRFFHESCAHKNITGKKYSLFYILFDFLAGSIYDIVYVLIKRDNLKWIFFAPLRRLAMNCGRFMGIIKSF